MGPLSDETAPVEDGSWSTGDAYQQPITDSTVTADVATASAQTDNSGQNSAWSGFGSIFDKVVSYGLAKDAAKTQLQLQQQRQQTVGVQPLITKSANGVSVSTSGALLVGAVVLGVVLLAHKA